MNWRALMTYSILTKNVDLLEACYKVASEYVVEKGYAQDVSGCYLEQLQNTDASVLRVIKQMRGESQ